MKNRPSPIGGRFPRREAVAKLGFESIKSYAFSYCGNLTSVTIPASISSVDSFAFSQCSALTDVYYAGTKAQANAITIGTGNTYFTAATWHFGAVDPESVDDVLYLPDSLATIESEAFAGVNAQKIVVPPVVSEIGSRAFAGSGRLRYLELPSGDITIADDILAGCDEVTIICQPGTPAEQWALAHGYPVINP